MVKELIADNPTIEIKEIWKVIRSMGYNGRQTAAYEQIGRIKGKREREFIPKIPSVFWLPSKVSLLLYSDRDKLPVKEGKLVDYLCRKSDEIGKAAELAKKFKAMMKNKDGIRLKDWVEEAISADVKELKGFARGLLTDFDAVQNVMILPWSNGQTYQFSS